MAGSGEGGKYVGRERDIFLDQGEMIVKTPKSNDKSFISNFRRERK